MNIDNYEKYYMPTKFISGWWWVALDADTDLPPELPGKKETEWFSNLEASQVEALTFWYGRNTTTRCESAYERLRDLSSFSQLKSLSIPLEVVPHIDISSVATHLEHLHIADPSVVNEAHFSDKNYRFLMFDEYFPALRTLKLFVSPKWCANFSVQKYPKLKWFTSDFDLDPKGIGLKFFLPSQTVQGFELNSITRKYTLKYLKTDVKALRFWSITAKSFDFGVLENFYNLEYLSIYSSVATVDCAALALLPNLNELTICSSRDILNIQSLLLHKKIKKLAIYLNRTQVNEELKNALRQHIEHVKFD